MTDFLFDLYFFKTLINTNDEVKKKNDFSKKKIILHFFLYNKLLEGEE